MWREVAGFAAWPAVETVSITCADDRVVNPDWSDRVARERLGVEPLRIPGGHSPFLSRRSGHYQLPDRDVRSGMGRTRLGPSDDAC
ncbi:hypothetical protein ACQPW3_26075 [Actinosynnema sp. CA-248983]